jgi:hypothetical protein
MPDNARTAWRQAVDTVAQNAREALPDCTGRITAAVKLVLLDDVTVLQDGSAQVASQTEPQKVYTVQGRQCPCKDYQAPDGYCTHVLAAFLYRRALERTATLVEQATGAGHEAPSQELPTAQEGHGIAPQWLVSIQHKPHVLYAGLLSMAHQQGLVRLEAQLVTVTAERATATATAVFADGRLFTKAADATPDNVGSRIKPHYPRMALTRAKARALRDALNLGDLVAAEELGEG